VFVLGGFVEGFSDEKKMGPLLSLSSGLEDLQDLSW
jgi:hypothetical protein